MIRKFVATEAERADNRRKLAALGERILAEVPGAAISADQLYREADLAIDFCEDVAPLCRMPPSTRSSRCLKTPAVSPRSRPSTSKRLVRLSYDKLSMTRIFPAAPTGCASISMTPGIASCSAATAFNDAPMFGFFPPMLAGVANADGSFADDMSGKPGASSPASAAAKALSKSRIEYCRPGQAFPRRFRRRSGHGIGNRQRCTQVFRKVRGAPRYRPDHRRRRISSCCWDRPAAGKSTLLRMIAGLEPITIPAKDQHR